MNKKTLKKNIKKNKITSIRYRMYDSIPVGHVCDIIQWCNENFGEGGSGKIDDVLVNNKSVVENRIAKIDLTDYMTTNTAQTITGAKTFKNGLFVGDTIAGSDRAIIDGKSIYISDGANNEHLTFTTSSIESDSDTFSIILDNGEFLSTLALSAAGALTWKNKNILTADDIVDSTTSTASDKALSANQGKVLVQKFANYLALTGGTLFGTIFHSGTSTYALKQADDDSYLKIAGGATDGHSAALFLYGNDTEDTQGMVSLRTSTGTGWGPILELYPTGKATWNGNDIIVKYNETITPVIATGMTSTNTSISYNNLGLSVMVGLQTTTIPLNTWTTVATFTIPNKYSMIGTRFGSWASEQGTYTGAWRIMNTTGGNTASLQVCTGNTANPTYVRIDTFIPWSN